VVFLIFMNLGTSTAYGYMLWKKTDKMCDMMQIKQHQAQPFPGLCLRSTMEISVIPPCNYIFHYCAFSHHLTYNPIRRSLRYGRLGKVVENTQKCARHLVVQNISMRRHSRLHDSVFGTHYLSHETRSIKKKNTTALSTLKKPSKNYACFILRRFGLFLIHLLSKNKSKNNCLKLTAIITPSNKHIDWI